jgi:hypothetical protein
MTQFTYIAIKVADEDQFNQVAEKLRGMGYYANPASKWGAWERKVADKNFHVLAHESGRFSIHSHNGGDFNPARYTYEQFMKL